MSDLSRTFFELARWCGEQNVGTESLTVILNFTDAHEAARFDGALRHGLAAVTYPKDRRPLDLRQFEMVGIKVRVESPLHSPW